MFHAAQLTSGRRLVGRSWTDVRQYTLFLGRGQEPRAEDAVAPGTLLGPEGSASARSPRTAHPDEPFVPLVRVGVGPGAGPNVS